MKKIVDASYQIWYDEFLISESVAYSLDPCYWQENDKIIGSAQGRGTTWFVQTPKLAGALRHYHRGGLLGRIVRDHYWFIGWNKTRSYQEFIVLEHLLNNGVHVPKPIAARATKKYLCYQADILTEKIPNAQDMISILKKGPLSSEIYIKMGEEIRKMHAANVNHTDLNIHNILIDDGGKVWIIDFDKCHIESSSTSNRTWPLSNMERLFRSFNKELDKHQIYWNKEQDWSALQAGYSN
ncbi:3-deoxy-D-manno-octulosonic acid kinase [Vibrio sp. S11_S32]|uniref:3-deoxy-D-manno-octulosonic acid kinase n=1 Tax=Vibrio sp. S11_S32 TaxID=2720225 RepID=UPI0016815CF7|nr:3-deoxy-D-manno-octulosonic acid kinase [Vibrio sp. S11_S32]MBD1576847.1 3-deoxy-D-manno-octulosonic acid kinase [Vibrio sp. S11_S32]